MTRDERIEDLTTAEMDILRKVREEGALLEPELPIKLDRDSDDLRDELARLCERRLVQVRTTHHYGTPIRIFLSCRGAPAL